MPETKDLVINTGPLIAIVAALNDLKVLQFPYRAVLVPFEVCREVTAKGSGSIGILLRAKKEGHPFSIRQAIDRMKLRGIRLSKCVIDFALLQSGEID